jgi:hypothetical protein
MKQGKHLKTATSAWFYKVLSKNIVQQTGVSKRRLKNALKKFNVLNKIAKATGERKPVLVYRGFNTVLPDVIRIAGVPPVFAIPYGK